MTIADEERTIQIEELKYMKEQLKFRRDRMMRKVNVMENLIDEYRKEIELLEEEE